MTGAVPLGVAAQAQPALADAVVVGHQCDRHGAVTALLIRVDSPGVLPLRWDNSQACGRPA